MPAKGQKRKQQIIDTAKDMFIQNGFQSTHIGQVCEKLNIARGTVYQYFGNKREILYAVLDQVEELIEDIYDDDDLRDILKTNPSQKSMLKFISDRLSKAIKVILDEPIVMKLIFKDIVGIDNEVVSRVNKFLTSIVDIATRNTEEIAKKGIYKKGLNSEMIAMVFMGAIMFVLYQYDQKKEAVNEKEITESIVTIIMNGVIK